MVNIIIMSLLYLLWLFNGIMCHLMCVWPENNDVLDGDSFQWMEAMMYVK